MVRGDIRSGFDWGRRLTWYKDGEVILPFSFRKPHLTVTFLAQLAAHVLGMWVRSTQLERPSAPPNSAAFMLPPISLIVIYRKKLPSGRHQCSDRASACSQQILVSSTFDRGIALLAFPNHIIILLPTNCGMYPSQVLVQNLNVACRASTRHSSPLNTKARVCALLSKSGVVLICE